MKISLPSLRSYYILCLCYMYGNTGLTFEELNVSFPSTHSMFVKKKLLWRSPLSLLAYMFSLPSFQIFPGAFKAPSIYYLATVKKNILFDPWKIYLQLLVLVLIFIYWRYLLSRANYCLQEDFTQHLWTPLLTCRIKTKIMISYTKQSLCKKMHFFFFF